MGIAGANGAMTSIMPQAQPLVLDFSQAAPSPPSPLVLDFSQAAPPSPPPSPPAEGSSVPDEPCAPCEAAKAEAEKVAAMPERMRRAHERAQVKRREDDARELEERKANVNKWLIENGSKALEEGGSLEEAIEAQKAKMEAEDRGFDSSEAYYFARGYWKALLPPEVFTAQFIPDAGTGKRDDIHSKQGQERNIYGNDFQGHEAAEGHFECRACKLA